MNPSTVKSLMETPMGEELKLFLAKMIVSLDTVADITADDPVVVAVEVKARKLAKDKLIDALGDLVSLADVREAEPGKSEYGM